MIKRIIALSLAAAATAGALVAPAQAARKTTIDLGDNFFSPDAATVKRGTTVVWDWTGQAPHNVSVVSGPAKFRSPVQTSGTYTRTLWKAGTYKIVCTIHPGMNLTLKVR